MKFGEYKTLKERYKVKSSVCRLRNRLVLEGRFKEVMEDGSVYSECVSDLWILCLGVIVLVCRLVGREEYTH